MTVNRSGKTPHELVGKPKPTQKNPRRPVIKVEPLSRVPFRIGLGAAFVVSVGLLAWRYNAFGLFNSKPQKSEQRVQLDSPRP